MECLAFCKAHFIKFQVYDQMDGELKMEKIKWYGVTFSLFILFLYVMGTYDIFMMLSYNAGYYESKGYGERAVLYFTDYPVYLLVFWILNLACGLISPILYLARNKHSYKVAFVSALADLILMILGVAFRDRIGALGINIFGFDLFILISTFLFGLFLYLTYRKNRT